MDEWKKSLIIRGQKFNYKELLAYSSDQIVSATTAIWEKEIYRFIINWLSDRSYIVQYSSGTTGKAKEVRLSKQTMIQSALNTCNFLGIQKGSTALLCMPVDFIAGKMMVVRCIMHEMNMLLSEPRSVPDIDKGCTVDFSAMVPFQATNILSCRGNLLPVKTLLIGGAEISQELENQIAELTTVVYSTYGMAETSSHIALKRLNGEEKQSSYKVLPGVRITTDRRGCLVIEADYLPSPVISNDLVELTGPGTFNWLGRYDNLINSGGFKIVPEEVENLVMEKTMLECVALGLPDKKLGQKLVFAFEKDEVPDSFSTLQSDLDNYLPRRWKPRELITVDKFPRNDALKIDRLKLTEMCLKKNQ